MKVTPVPELCGSCSGGAAPMLFINHHVLKRVSKFWVVRKLPSEQHLQNLSVLRESWLLSKLNLCLLGMGIGC